MRCETIITDDFVITKTKHIVSNIQKLNAIDNIVIILYNITNYIILYTGVTLEFVPGRLICTAGRIIHKLFYTNITKVVWSQIIVIALYTIWYTYVLYTISCYLFVNSTTTYNIAFLENACYSAADNCLLHSSWSHNNNYYYYCDSLAGTKSLLLLYFFRVQHVVVVPAGATTSATTVAVWWWHNFARRALLLLFIFIFYFFSLFVFLLLLIYTPNCCTR